MPELNIYFFGLICHVDINDSGRPDYAAIVRAGTHQSPVIRFDGGKDYRLIEHDISFKHGFAPPDTASDYDQYVPKLRSIVGGTLAIDEDEVWRFQYPRAQGGRAELSVADFYANNGIHRSKGSNRVKRAEAPVARIVRLRVPLQDRGVTVVFTDEDGVIRDEKPISSNSCILISNLESQSLRDAGLDLVYAGAGLRTLLENWMKQDAVKTELTGIDGVLAFADRIQSAGLNLKEAAEVHSASDLNHFEHYSMIVAGADTAVAKRGKKLKNKPAPSFACDWVADHVGYGDDYYPRGAARPECGNTNWP
ncbi:MAG TPA: hypothetical protein VGF28_00940 [Thermoanaerobaculia bacterium]